MRRRCHLVGQTHLYQVKTLFNIYCCYCVVVYRWLCFAAHFVFCYFKTFIFYLCCCFCCCCCCSRLVSHTLNLAIAFPQLIFIAFFLFAQFTLFFCFANREYTRVHTHTLAYARTPASASHTNTTTRRRRRRRRQQAG